jgi:hypothetical protein
MPNNRTKNRMTMNLVKILVKQKKRNLRRLNLKSQQKKITKKSRKRNLEKRKIKRMMISVILML